MNSMDVRNSTIRNPSVRSSAFRRPAPNAFNRLKAELQTVGRAYELFAESLTSILDGLNPRLAA